MRLGRPCASGRKTRSAKAGKTDRASLSKDWAFFLEAEHDSEMGLHQVCSGHQGLVDKRAIFSADRTLREIFCRPAPGITDSDLHLQREQGPSLVAADLQGADDGPP